jgi:hypothetical protein
LGSGKFQLSRHCRALNGHGLLLVINRVLHASNIAVLVFEAPTIEAASFEVDFPALDAGVDA